MSDVDYVHELCEWFIKFDTMMRWSCISYALDECNNIVELTAKAGIRAGCYFMFGFLDEAIDEMNEILNNAFLQPYLSISFIICFCSGVWAIKLFWNIEELTVLIGANTTLRNLIHCRASHCGDRSGVNLLRPICWKEVNSHNEYIDSSTKLVNIEGF